MDSAWLKRLLGQVDKRKRMFEVPGYRQSRRVEGLFDRDDEIYGFKNLCVYVDSGLVGRESQIAEILSCVDSNIYGHEHHCHTRWLMFFGNDQATLAAPGPSRVHHAIRACNWEGTLKKYMSPRTVSAPVIIPRLHNPGSLKTRCPGANDLGLFFCQGRGVYVRSEEELALFRRVASRCIWVLFDGDETAQMETGPFMPLLIEHYNAHEQGLFP